MIITPLRRRLIAALIGVGVIVANRAWGVELTGLEPILVDTVIALLSAVLAETVPDTKFDDPGDHNVDASP